MNIKTIVRVLVAISASTAVSAFASSYGPAPFYQPLAGAPASQRGQSSQTFSSERDFAGQAYGGTDDQTQSSRRPAPMLRDALHTDHYH